MFWGIPSRHRQSLILSSITSFRSLCILYHFVLPLSRCFFFRFSLSSYQFAVNPLPVAFALCGVLSSSTTLSVHVLQIAFSESGRCAWWRSVRVILDCSYCITMYSQNQPQICISLGRNFVRMIYHTPVGYHDCQPWLAGSTLVVRD